MLRELGIGLLWELLWELLKSWWHLRIPMLRILRIHLILRQSKALLLEPLTTLVIQKLGRNDWERRSAVLSPIKLLALLTKVWPSCASFIERLLRRGLNVILALTRQRSWLSLSRNNGNDSSRRRLNSLRRWTSSRVRPLRWSVSI
jgi:hypothetical protein